VTVWLTGAHGMLGRAVATQLDQLGVSRVGSDLEIDMSSEAAVRDFALERRPRVILNCAAHTAVDVAEKDESTALKVNGRGPGPLARLATELDSTLAHVSTDYVFDGTLPKGQAYTEASETCPCNAYGRTKLSGELQIAKAFSQLGTDVACSWVVLRTSWLFGSGRSSFVDTMWRSMLEKDELRVVDDQIGRPTYVEDLASVMMRVCGISGQTCLPSGVWHFANAGPISWHGFATAIRDQMLAIGLPVTVKDIHRIPSEEYPRPAKRPKNSVLSTARIKGEGRVVPRHWQAALIAYIQKRRQRDEK